MGICTVCCKLWKLQRGFAWWAEGLEEEDISNSVSWWHRAGWRCAGCRHPAEGLWDLSWGDLAQSWHFQDGSACPGRPRSEGQTNHNWGAESPAVHPAGQRRIWEAKLPASSQRKLGLSASFQWTSQLRRTYSLATVWPATVQQANRPLLKTPVEAMPNYKESEDY